jgi:hypothetical protein
MVPFLTLGLPVALCLAIAGCFVWMVRTVAVPRIVRRVVDGIFGIIVISLMLCWALLCGYLAMIVVGVVNLPYRDFLEEYQRGIEWWISRNVATGLTLIRFVMQAPVAWFVAALVWRYGGSLQRRVSFMKRSTSVDTSASAVRWFLFS